MTIDDAVKHAAKELETAGIDEPFREANLLLGHILGKGRAHLISHASDELSPEQIDGFLDIVKRRADHEPFHYITGEKEFYGLPFYVDPSVLIPRPETELLVAEAIGFLNERMSPTFCEIGVGSGCISVSILHNIANANGVAGDISDAAIGVAAKNAKRHSVEDRLRLVLSDIFSAMPDEKFDLIVSNPPYIPAGDIATLEKDVRDFEPRSALTDGTDDGLAIIGRIVAEAPRFLKESGRIMFEFGFGQKNDIASFFDAAVWKDVRIMNDLASIPRIVAADRH
jgi:release factor glutamine methyltransferase